MEIHGVLVGKGLCASQGCGGSGLGKNINEEPCPWKGENQKQWISKWLSVFQPALSCHNVYVLTKGEGLKRL